MKKKILDLDQNHLFLKVHIREIHSINPKINWNDKIVVDVGAECGDTPLYFANMGAKVFAFEPLKKHFEFFLKELERISTKGYIELPTRLGDNLVFENKNDHIWWFYFNDTANKLIVSKKNQLIDPFITVSTAKLFEEIFRESLVIELAWEDKIDYKIDINSEYLL